VKNWNDFMYMGAYFAVTNRDYIEYKIHCIRGTGNDADDDKVVRIRDILDLEVWIDAKLEESDFQV